MVSPAKRRKQDKKGKESAAVDFHNPQRNNSTVSGSKKSNKLAKPLNDKKFYLDIKNHVALKKLEEKLKSLGASLELFLVKDVDYVVTDRADYPRLKTGDPRPSPSPSFNPSPFCSVSPANTDSPTDGVVFKRTRSRAEAMLEKCKHEPQRANGDILDNAASWQIPIYPLPKFIHWLEKVTRKAEKLSSEWSGVRELRGCYLKVESCGRPEFRLFSAWPSLSFEPETGGFAHRPLRSNAAPRHHPNAVAQPPAQPTPQRMTRKVGKITRDVSTGGGSGYCEVCRCNYGQLEEHIASSTHLKLVSDPNQYSQLDSIITQHSLGNRKSLRIAKSPPPVVVDMGGKQSSETPLVNGHMTRSKHSSPPLQEVHCNGVVEKKVEKNHVKEKKETTKERSSSDCGTIVEAGSPTGETGHHNLRSRRSTPAKRSRVSRKRLSAEEKLIEDNKAYYRVEVLNSKLRSTGYMINSQRQIETQRASETTPQVNGEKQEVKEEKEPVVVRFRKVRKTQLALLSDEAESFMFGEPKRDSSPELSPDEGKDQDSSDEGSSPRKMRFRRRRAERRDSSPELSPEEPMTLRSRRRDSSPEQSQDEAKPEPRKLRRRDSSPEQSQDEAKPEPRKLRRRDSSPEHSQDEAKPEPRKLRRRDSSPEHSQDEAKPEPRKLRRRQRRRDSSQEDEGSSRPSTRLRSSRQQRDSSADVSQESDESSNKKRRRTHAEAFIEDNHDYYKFEVVGSRLRFQEEPVPPPTPQQPQIDITVETAASLRFSFETGCSKEPWYQTYSRYDSGMEYHFPQHWDYPKVRLPYEYPMSERARANNFKKYLRKRDRTKFLLDDKPRKSPRCHASTLAIMSSLMRRGRPRECDRTRSEGNFVSSYDEETISSIVDTCNESSCNSEIGRFLSETDATTLERKIHQMLHNTFLRAHDDRYGRALLKALEIKEEEEETMDKKPLMKIQVECSGMCLDVDPSVLEEVTEDLMLPLNSGLNMDMGTLLQSYSQCTTMEKPDFEHPHFRAFDAFRSINFDGSCNSSDCSDLFGFSEDGRVVSGRRRKRKKRNLTGWPLGKPKKKKEVVSSPLVKLEPLESMKVVDGEETQWGDILGLDSPKKKATTLIQRTFEEPSPKRKVGRPPKRPLLIIPNSPSYPPPPPVTPSPVHSPPKKRTRTLSRLSRY